MAYKLEFSGTMYLTMRYDTLHCVP